MSENKIFDYINQLITDNQIVLFMKGTTDFPQCGFSSYVVQAMKKNELSFKDINVLESEELRQGIKEFSDWPTIPQLYINGEFVGGCDIVRQMVENGEFTDLVKNLQKA